MNYILAPNYEGKERKCKEESIIFCCLKELSGSLHCQQKHKWLFAHILMLTERARRYRDHTALAVNIN